MPLPETALIIGASGGLGAALADHLADHGCRVLRRSRSIDGLDITDEASVAAMAKSLREAGESPDWILVATGALTVNGTPPERAFRYLDPQVMARSYAINAIGPALLFKHLAPLLPRSRPAVFAALSARLASVGDNGLGGWMSYRASKTALNQLLRCGSIEIRRRWPQAVVAGLHPGTVETELSRPYARGRYTASSAESAAQLVAVLDGLTPEDTGSLFAYDGQRIPW